MSSLSIDEARLLMQVARDASLGVTFEDRFGAMTEALLSLVPGFCLGAMVLEPNAPPSVGFFHNNDPANLALYAQHYVHVDPMGPGIAEATGRPHTLSQVVRDKDFGDCEFTDFLSRNSIRHIMGLTVALPEGEKRLALTIHRSSGQGDFSDHERRLVELVAGDLGRAAFGTVLRSQLAELAESQLDPIRSARAGGMILGPRGELRHIDPGAIAILRDHDEALSMESLSRFAEGACSAQEGASGEHFFSTKGGAIRVVVTSLAGAEAMVVLELIQAKVDTFAEVAGRAGLTPREREVAQLAVEGLGNQGIAHRLGISPVTVGVHLGKVYRKVKVGGRTELARTMSTG